MLDKLIDKTIIKNKAHEYEELGKLIISSPIQVFDYDIYLKELENTVKENKNFIKNKKFAIFYNLKTITISDKTYKLPELDQLLYFLKKKFTVPVLSIMLAENFEQCLINYIKENKQ